MKVPPRQSPFPRSVPSQPGYRVTPARRSQARFGCLAAATAIILAAIALAGAVIMWQRPGDDDPGPIQSPEPTVSTAAPTPGAPAATTTVTVFVTPLANPPVSATREDSGNGAAWIAALGAIIAGLGTLASGAAAWATVRRDDRGGGRRIHRRTEGQGRRSPR